jgi:hypothetical protein
VSAAILGDVDATDRARLRAYAEETLAALGAPDLGVPVRVVDPRATVPQVGRIRRA